MQSLNKVIFLFLILFMGNVNAENTSGNKWSFYTGMFDFSDDGKKSNLIGIEHINTNLHRDSFLGTLQPVTGLMVTADNAAYFNTGFQIQSQSEGPLKFTPSFTPGYYNKGDGKDLGHSLEFKSELQFSIDLPLNAQLGFSYNHISNAILGSKNPGANSYMFNFMKQF